MSKKRAGRGAKALSIGLIAAGAAQPMLTEPAQQDRDPGARPVVRVFPMAAYTAARNQRPDLDIPPMQADRHDDTGAEHAWNLEVRMRAETATIVPRPVGVTVTSVGVAPRGGVSRNPVTLTVAEEGDIGEMFHITEIAFMLVTEGVRFVGRPVVSSQIAARAQVEGQHLTATTPSRRRRVPWVHVVSGLKLQADREVASGTVVRLRVVVRSDQGPEWQRDVGSPGTVRDGDHVG